MHTALLKKTFGLPKYSLYLLEWVRSFASGYSQQQLQNRWKETSGTSYWTGSHNFCNTSCSLKFMLHQPLFRPQFSHIDFFLVNSDVCTVTAIEVWTNMKTTAPTRRRRMAFWYTDWWFNRLTVKPFPKNSNQPTESSHIGWRRVRFHP